MHIKHCKLLNAAYFGQLCREHNSRIEILLGTEKPFNMHNIIVCICLSENNEVQLALK